MIQKASNTTTTTTKQFNPPKQSINQTHRPNTEDPDVNDCRKAKRHAKSSICYDECEWRIQVGEGGGGSVRGGMVGMVSLYLFGSPEASKGTS